jgi:hypothetical protein
LARPNWVNRTADAAIIKDAVAVDFLAQADLRTDLPRKARPNFRPFLAAMAGDRLDFRIVHPNKARRPSAAISAPRTLKSQAGPVPETSLHGLSITSIQLIS